jgi:hypothetical protein
MSVLVQHERKRAEAAGSPEGAENAEAAEAAKTA